MMVEPILKIEGLEKNFGALKVSDDIWLDILPGEIHAVIGPNGAGKTTLIAQVSGLLAPDAGRIVFHGEDITGRQMHERVKRGLARSFQITNILPEFTALENVALAVQAREGSSLSFFRAAADEAPLNTAALVYLGQFGLEGRAGTVAGALSHGEKRRLELAIAIATEPKLLLLDEPMAGAGSQETETLMQTLNGLRGRYSIMLVEHDMRAVFTLADRISVMVYGRIIATGEPDEIRKNAEVRTAYLGKDAA